MIQKLSYHRVDYCLIAIGLYSDRDTARLKILAKKQLLR